MNDKKERRKKLEKNFGRTEIFRKKIFWRVRGKGFLQKTRYPPPGYAPVLFALYGTIFCRMYFNTIAL